MEEIEDIIAGRHAEAPDSPDDEDPAEDSWTTEDENTIAKQTDRHFFIYRETVLPEKVQAFFSLQDLEPGKKQKIVLWQQENRFDAFIERTIHDPPLTRLRWGQDLAALVQAAFPEWMEFFKKSRSESDDTPSVYLSRRPVPGEYDIAFEGVVVRAAKTAFEAPVQPGSVIDNDTLREFFRCSSAGTMRRSQSTGSLVLVSDHTRPGCSDQWIGKTFHFTGMGLSGEPGLSFNQNKTLCESGESGTRLFLFEVFKPGQFTYIGETELVDNPYLSRQTDSEGKARDVTVFPLQLKGGSHPPLIRMDVAKVTAGPTARPAQQPPRVEPEPESRRPAIPESSGIEEIPDVFDGDDIVSEYAKRRADGTC